MKRKRIQYNELNEEIYRPIYWTQTRLILVGIVLVIFGFLINFSLEDKINKFLQTTLSSNGACPILFEKAELSYFLPKVIIKKPVILGACFGQVNNKLPLKDIKIALHSPSFYPPGIKLHVSITEGKTNINLYPAISLFSQYIDIEETHIDSQIFAGMTVDNKSPIAGMLSVNGFIKLESGVMVDGQLSIKSKDFYIPAQNISGFEMTKLNLSHLNIQTHFTNKTIMQIDTIEIGQAGMPIELKLKGNLLINPTVFINSNLQLSGTLHLSNYILVNFAFIKIFLPAENSTGTYQMKINGPLGNIGKPQLQ